MGRQHSFFIHFEGGRLGNMIISTERRLSGDRLETNWSELRGFEAGPRPSGGRRPIYNQALLKFSALSHFPFLSTSQRPLLVIIIFVIRQLCESQDILRSNIVRYDFNYLLFWIPATALSQSLSSIFQTDQSCHWVKINSWNHTTVYSA